MQASRTPGFDDVESKGGADMEDAAPGMGSGTPYPRGAVKVKGADRGTQMRDIDQCNRRAKRRAEGDDGPPKGILVPNQHRLMPCPDSRDARVRFEDNQLRQAAEDDIRTIPSCVLFEAARQVLGGRAPDRAGIAARIAASKGVLEDVS